MTSRYEEEWQRRSAPRREPPRSDELPADRATRRSAPGQQPLRPSELPANPAIWRSDHFPLAHEGEIADRVRQLLDAMDDWPGREPRDLES